MKNFLLCLMKGAVRVKKIPIRQIRWGRVLLVLLAAALLVAGMNSCHGLIHYNGTPYRKRIVAFAAMTFVSALLAAYAPPENKRWKYSRLAYVILGIVAGGMAFQCITSSVFYEPPISAPFFPMLVLLSAIIYLVVWLLLWDSRRAVIAYYWLMCLLGYGYECVYWFRGTVFRVADLLSIGTALNVVGSYTFSVAWDTMFWCLGGVMLWSLSGWVKRQKIQKKAAKLIKPIGVLLSAGLIWLLIGTQVMTSWGVVTHAWPLGALRLNRKYSTLVMLLKECQDITYIRPNNYDSFETEDARLLQPGVTIPSSARPNVVVIMNESMADLSSLWKIETDRDPLAFLHTLREETLYGNLYVSSYGGSTSNTEHSFLTATMAAPIMNMPLLATAREVTPALPWLMKAQGYTTIAMHPCNPSNYQRDTIYPRLGFERFLSEPDFEGNEKLRSFMSDRACYQKIISLYEQKAEDERLFIFNVTMQNHGDYQKGGVEQSVKLSENTDHRELDEYLNLIAISDEALRELIQYFSQQQEPTVLLFFGDHQPALELSMFEKRPGLSAVEQQITQYITPFFIWANYPIKTGYVEALSVHYLAPLLQQTAGLPMTGYDQWLLEMSQRYPVALLSGYAEKNGEFVEWNDAEWPQTLQLMNCLRYNRLYDKDGRLPALELIR